MTGTELLEARTSEYPREDAVELHDAWPVPGDRPRPRSIPFQPNVDADEVTASGLPLLWAVEHHAGGRVFS